MTKRKLNSVSKDSKKINKHIESFTNIIAKTKKEKKCLENSMEKFNTHSWKTH